MDDKALKEGLEAAMPVARAEYRTGTGPVGLILVDVIDGFCTPGMGNLAPPAGPRPDAIADMVAVSDRLARAFVREAGQGARRHVLALKDTHEADRPEPPYPPHCIRGTGEELLVAELRWLEESPHALCVEKDVINGFVGLGHEGRNDLVRWLNGLAIETVVVCGICTDICTSDLVTTLLSARNHRNESGGKLLPHLTDVVVHDAGNATYDLPRAVAEQIGLPPQAAHPAGAAHHIGLWTMQARGAIIASSVDGV